MGEQLEKGKIDPRARSGTLLWGPSMSPWAGHICPAFGARAGAARDCHTYRDIGASASHAGKDAAQTPGTRRLQLTLWGTWGQTRPVFVDLGQQEKDPRAQRPARAGYSVPWRD